MNPRYNLRRRKAVPAAERRLSAPELAVTLTPRSVINLAQDEARRLGHNFVGTEQMMIAIIRCHSGIAPGVLADLGLTVEEVRTEVESIIGWGSGFVAVEIPFTPRAKRVL